MVMMMALSQGGPGGGRNGSDNMKGALDIAKLRPKLDSAANFVEDTFRARLDQFEQEAVNFEEEAAELKKGAMFRDCFDKLWQAIITDVADRLLDHPEDEEAMREFLCNDYVLEKLSNVFGNSYQDLVAANGAWLENRGDQWFGRTRMRVDYYEHRRAEDEQITAGKKEITSFVPAKFREFIEKETEEHVLYCQGKKREIDEGPQSSSMAMENMVRELATDSVTLILEQIVTYMADQVYETRVSRPQIQTEVYRCLSDAFEKIFGESAAKFFLKDKGIKRRIESKISQAQFWASYALHRWSLKEREAAEKREVQLERTVFGGQVQKILGEPDLTRQDDDE